MGALANEKEPTSLSPPGSDKSLAIQPTSFSAVGHPDASRPLRELAAVLPRCLKLNLCRNAEATANSLITITSAIACLQTHTLSERFRLKVVASPIKTLLFDFYWKPAKMSKLNTPY
ncbi:hypothetical protein MJO28_014063 [Puccinia striiformis f. sp. tritici]|uniref:Uncharacterized protein n=1 Tax=Puccinia striiformis f. sp. tritici TaxID=168172 RepID=A0ACC0DWM1_9BASI|nr:hypothetical protein MJO28_014063 [Puccinia striiformis f. sp. tritici]